MWWKIAAAFLLGFVVAIAAAKSGAYDVALIFVDTHHRIFLVGGAFAAALGAGVAANQLRRNARLASVNFAAQALKEFAADKDMQDVFYDIEYNRFEYPKEGFRGGSPEERRIDRLLRHFAAVALVWKEGLVKSGDLVLIRYYVVRTMRDRKVMRYVDFVCEQWAKKAQKVEHPYAVLKRFHEYLEKSSDFSDSAGTAR